MKTIVEETGLSQCQETQCGVILFLMNGYQLRGTIEGFDDQVVVLVTDGKQQVIYKHAISTMVPEKPITL